MCVFRIQSSLFPHKNSGRCLSAGVGIACRRHCPERFVHPLLLVPARCGGI